MEVDAASSDERGLRDEEDEPASEYGRMGVDEPGGHGDAPDELGAVGAAEADQYRHGRDR
jgi:hypothetical protein